MTRRGWGEEREREWRRRGEGGRVERVEVLNIQRKISRRREAAKNGRKNFCSNFVLSHELYNDMFKLMYVCTALC